MTALPRTERPRPTRQLKQRRRQMRRRRKDAACPPTRPHTPPHPRLPTPLDTMAAKHLFFTDDFCTMLNFFFRLVIVQTTDVLFGSSTCSAFLLGSPPSSTLCHLTQQDRTAVFFNF